MIIAIIAVPIVLFIPAAQAAGEAVPGDWFDADANRVLDGLFDPYPVLRANSTS